MQFSVKTCLILTALVAIVSKTLYEWHSWAIERCTPFNEQPTLSFVTERAILFQWSTPTLICFALVSLVFLWHSCKSRDIVEIAIAALSIFAFTTFLTPASILSVFVAVQVIALGVLCIARKRTGLGIATLLHSVGWILFVLVYHGEWLRLTGD